MIENDPDIANSRSKDRTFITAILLFKYALGIAKLVFIIMTFSYFLGVFWQVISFVMYKATEEENKALDDAIYNTETFITTNDLDVENSSRTNTHNMVLLMYFSYTTLSTVGFGDFNPRSDQERLLCIVVLLLGVGIFGQILNNFLEIIEKFNKLEEEIDDGDMLSMFFDCLKKRYNYDIEIDKEQKRKIEQYFSYRWTQDKNQAIDEPEELAYLEQLPEDTQNMLYCEYLYKDFLYSFRYVFNIPKPDGKYYSWLD